MVERVYCYIDCFLWLMFNFLNIYVFVDFNFVVIILYFCSYNNYILGFGGFFYIVCILLFYMMYYNYMLYFFI